MGSQSTRFPRGMHFWRLFATPPLSLSLSLLPNSLSLSPSLLHNLAIHWRRRLLLSPLLSPKIHSPPLPKGNCVFHCQLMAEGDSQEARPRWGPKVHLTKSGFCFVRKRQGPPYTGTRLLQFQIPILLLRLCWLWRRKRGVDRIGRIRLAPRAMRRTHVHTICICTMLKLFPCSLNVPSSSDAMTAASIRVVITMCCS